MQGWDLKGVRVCGILPSPLVETLGRVVVVAGGKRLSHPVPTLERRCLPKTGVPWPSFTTWTICVCLDRPSIITYNIRYMHFVFQVSTV